MRKRILAFLAGSILMVSLFLNQTVNAAEIQTKPDLKKIDDYVGRMMKECRIPGFSLAIVKGDDVIYTQGYGIADPTGRKVTPQTPFIVASMSKTFTALAVMQLAEAGKISLDEPVSKYLTWFELADRNASQTITVRQLLSHTSGIGPSAEYSVASLTGEGDSIGQVVEKMHKLKLTAPVGSKFQYSNANYIILGQLVKVVSGIPYEDYVKQNIFEPLGMKHSYFSPDEAKKPRMAAGYRTIFGFPSVSGLPYRTDFTPAAGVITCSEDLSKYMLMLINGGIYGSKRVISADGLARMLEPAAKVSNAESYGLGWYVTSGSYYHGGELTDFQSKLKILPDESLGVAFVYNTSGSTATTLFKAGYRDRIESGIINILYGLDPDDAPNGGIFDLNSYPMTVTYCLYIVLCLIVVFLFAYSFVRMLGLRKRLMNGKSRIVPVILLTLAFNFILPFILLRIPGWLHFTWIQLMYYIPDVSYFTLSTIVFLLLCGIIKAVIIKVFLRPAKPKVEKHMYVV